MFEVLEITRTDNSLFDPPPPKDLGINNYLFHYLLTHKTLELAILEF
jgi:hypothetical protein